MDKEGYTPLYKAALEGLLENVIDPIAWGANPDKPSEGGLRPLYAAAQEGHTHIVNFLMLQGADVRLHTAAAKSNVDILESFIAERPELNHEDNTGWTLLNAAVQFGHLENVKYLMNQGAAQTRYDGMTQLHDAARCGHLDIVKFFISKGADLNEANFIGRIPLHSAVIDGNTEVMEYLIQQGSDVNKKDTTGWTPFNAAVQNGHLDVLKYLVTKGAKQTSFRGIPPLHVASLFGHLDVVKYFISKGADVNEGDAKWKIPLHGAASRGHMKVMECLIQHGSDVNKADAKGLTPFNAAIRNGQLEAVKYLLTRGAEQNRYDGMTQLHAAAQFGHLDIVKFFIEKGADVNKEDDEGMIPLHHAAFGGHTEVIEYLIQHGSDINTEDAKGWVPLNAAVQCGHLEAVKYLLIGGAKQNRYNGMTPLHAAAQFGHLDIVKFFIDKGADVNKGDDEGRIPLHDAASGGHIEVMKYLIQCSSDVNKQDTKGWTPFNAAVQYGHLEAVKYLLIGGAKQNRYAGMTPLYVAAQFGHLDIVNLFIDKGADVNEQNDNGMTPLHGAAFEGHMKVMEYLIHQGSDVNKEDAKGLTPLNAAVQGGYLEDIKYLMTKGAKQNRYQGITTLYAATYFGHSHIVDYFISKGADVNEENDKGMIPLHGAAMRGHLKVMEYLIQQGSDVNKNDCRGWTPLHAAVKNGHLEVVKFLMAKGARSTTYQGLTPLYIATRYDNVDVVNLLVSNGYDVNERIECGQSPLHAACYNGNMDIVKLLVHHNANVNEQDDDGWTPLKAAEQEGHQHVADYLALNGADMHERDIDVDDFTPLREAANTTNPHAIEGFSPSRGDPEEEETGDPRPGGHQNIITRGYVTVTMKDGHTQLESQVDYAEEASNCHQADDTERGANEHSLKSLPIGINGDEKGGNGEYNPFIHAKLKRPDKGEQDPMLDQMEAVKCTGAMERDTTTNGTDCSPPRKPQTGQYNGFDPPNLQTMEADGHPSEEPESRCHSPIDENREIKESSSPMNAGDDQTVEEPSEIESFLKHPPDVVHQKLYDRNHGSIHATFSNPVRKIRTKRQKSIYRCPSMLAFVQTFLQMIVALVIILAGSRVLVAGIDIIERVTLQAGKPGVVPFYLPWPPNSTSHGYYTLGFKSMPRPFCINGEVDVKGFKSPSQESRFTTSFTDLDTSSCVNLMIDNVDILDGDGYVLTAVWHSFENVRYETVKKEIVVRIPPGPAKCFITLSENSDYPYEVHCRATSRSVTTTISCYQNDQNIDVKGDITDNGLITSGIFLLADYTYFRCCAHDITSHVSAKMCNDFEWPHSKETTRQTVHTVPTSVTTSTTQIESHIASGACRQFKLPSLWHFTYLFVYILAFVTIY